MNRTGSRMVIHIELAHSFCPHGLPPLSETLFVSSAEPPRWKDVPLAQIAVTMVAYRERLPNNTLQGSRNSGAALAVAAP